MKLLRFNLEQALAGAKVVTRDERVVSDLYYFKSSHYVQKLYAVVEGEILSFDDDGAYMGLDVPRRLDLFMVEQPL